eukprot:356401-Chlamydomonas_euryale.AAC.2
MARRGAAAAAPVSTMVRSKESSDGGRGIALKGGGGVTAAGAAVVECRCFHAWVAMHRDRHRRCCLGEGHVSRIGVHGPIGERRVC